MSPGKVGCHIATDLYWLTYDIHTAHNLPYYLFYVLAVVMESKQLTALRPFFQTQPTALFTKAFGVML